MAQISRSTKVGGGTTLSSNTLARAVDVETDILTMFNAHNNHDTGTSKWQVGSFENSSSTVLIANNSSGTNDIVDFRDNGTSAFKVADAGVATFAPGGTTKAVVNSSGITLSNSATIAMGSAKITGLAAATTAGDALRYEHLNRLASYRRPTLLYRDATTVNVELGTATNSTSSVDVLFRDGDLRSVTDTNYYRFDITRNASLTGTKQSGLRTSLSEAVNTWYAIYAVKASDDSSIWVAVGDTTQPSNGANVTTLNSAYGTDGWVYLGMIRNGDNAGATGDILAFAYDGHWCQFTNATNNTAVGSPGVGLRLASTGGATTLTYSYSAGTGATNIPTQAGRASYMGCWATVTGKTLLNAAGTIVHHQQIYASGVGQQLVTIAASEGVQLQNGPGSSIAYTIQLAGFADKPLAGYHSSPYAG
jgi:hypothetical protein